MLVDEPNATYFDAIANCYEDYLALYPNKIPHVNLLPNYASTFQLQADTYQDYIDQFFEKSKPGYASFDFYPLNVGNKIVPDYFVNLEVFSTACRENNVPFGIYIQSCSFGSGVAIPTEAGMRWQAFNSLAFGATAIEYFTYRSVTTETEVWEDAMIGHDNEKTNLWYGAQKVNKELASLADAYMQYKHLGCWGVNMQNAPGHFYFSNQYTGFDALTNVTVSENKTVLMGGFVAKEGDNRAFVCVNANNPGEIRNPIDVTVQLAEGYTRVVLYQGGVATEIEADANGCVSFSLACGEGVFAEIEK